MIDPLYGTLNSWQKPGQQESVILRFIYCCDPFAWEPKAEDCTAASHITRFIIFDWKREKANWAVLLGWNWSVEINVCHFSLTTKEQLIELVVQIIHGCLLITFESIHECCAKNYLKEVTSAKGRIESIR